MRSSTIRTMWQIRYLPILSFAWFVTVWQLCAFTASMAVTVFIPVAWPESKPLLIVMLVGLGAWPWIISLRMVTVRRADQNFWQALSGILLMPLGGLWYLLILRQIRFWGIASCTKQGWVTRQQGVEVHLHPEEAS
jgi:hyaluronan synthase